VFSASGCARHNGAAWPCARRRSIAIGVPQADVDAKVLLGDLMIVRRRRDVGGQTLIVKATALLRAPAEKGLGYQVAISIPILALAAWISGETLTGFPGRWLVADGLSGDLVVGLTFLLWFALSKPIPPANCRHLLYHAVVRRGGSYFIMHDTLTLAFGAAALLVIGDSIWSIGPKFPGRRSCRIPTFPRDDGSAGLDRQRDVPGPFSHRAIVKAEIVVAEPVEQEQVDGGRDAAAAIGDHALVLADALHGKFSPASASERRPLSRSNRVAADTLTLPGMRPGRP